jgi:Pentapeptide repeats (8 copies)
LGELDDKKLIAEIDNLETSTKKTRVDTSIAIDSQKGTSFFRNFPVTQVTVVLALLTFLFQSYQMFLQVQSHEDTEWRQAVKSLSFVEGKALPGALNVSTFYKSSKYGDKARQLVAASLPHIAEPSSFDAVYFEFREGLNETQLNYLYGVNLTLRKRYSRFFDKVRITGQLISPVTDESQPPRLFRESFSKLINKDTEQRIAAEDLEDEIDSSTHGLETTWQANRQLKRQATSIPLPRCKELQEDLNLTHLLIKYSDDEEDATVDLSKLDFSCSKFFQTYMANVNLAGTSLNLSDLTAADLSAADFTDASMKCVRVDGADFGDVTKFTGSDWTGTDWSKATVSGALKEYLKKNFPLPAKFACPVPIN